MKKIFNLILMSVIFVGCQQDDVNIEEHEKLNQGKFKIQLTSKLDEADFSKLTVKVIDSNTKEEFIAEADNNGVATFNLPNNKADYDVTVKGADNNYLYGELKNTKITTNRALRVGLRYDKEDYSGFVLDELYFNGTKNGDFNYTYYEQYFTIYNNTNEPKKVAGLSFGICGDYNNTPRSSTNGMISIMPKEIALSQVYTIPSGTPKLGKGKSLVIALWGKNHKIPTDEEHFVKPNSLNLTGADLEIYVPHDYCMTKDEVVPNVDVNFSTFEAFHWQPTGSSPLVLFKVDGDINTHIRKNKKEYINPASSNRKQDYVVIPTLSIIDGVETGSKGKFTRKVLPRAIDKIPFKIPGSGMLGTGYDGHFIRRKKYSNGKLRDTDSSKRDFVLKHKTSLDNN